MAVPPGVIIIFGCGRFFEAIAVGLQEGQDVMVSFIDFEHALMAGRLLVLGRGIGVPTAGGPAVGFPDFPASGGEAQV